MDNLKDYIRKRVEAIQSNDLNRPKSMLLLGIPGCGKSLAAKSIAKILKWPLIRFDVGALKGSLVGQSEANMREALKEVIHASRKKSPQVIEHPRAKLRLVK